MPSDDDNDIEGMLRRLRAQADEEGADPEQLWALAAGELPPEQAAQVAARARRSRRSMEELGIATHLLDDSDARAEAVDVEGVMRRIRAEQAVQRRRRNTLRWVAGLGCATAAAAALVLVLRPPHLESLPIAVTDVARAENRGGAASGVQFRVQLQPREPVHALLFLLEGEGGRRALLRRHPPVDAVLAEPEYAPWPRNPLPAGSITLPHRAPPDLNLFTLEGRSGFVIVCWSQRRFDEVAIAAIAEGMQRVLPSVLTEAGIAEAFAGLELPEVQISVRSVTAQ